MFATGNKLISFRGPLGVPVEIHSSALILGALLVFLGSRNSLAFGVIFVAALFLSIFLHELGHAWAAKVQKVPVSRIVIWGGGGFCEHARAPSPKVSEFVVIMGPLTNLAIWAIVGILPFELTGILLVDAGINVFGYLNLFLALFNLVPVHPLDGGKLTQLFAMRFMSARDATRLSGGIGLVFCVLWIPILVASFVFVGFVLMFIPSWTLHKQMWDIGR